MKTLVLLSGGLDSTVILASLVKNHDECSAIGFYYQQEHDIELDKAEEIASYYDVPFSKIELPSLPKPEGVVYPGRNLLFAAAAVCAAHALKCGRIAIGCNSTDWHDFPDCRPVFWASVKNAVADAYDIVVSTPLMHYTKIDIVKMARELQVPIDMTWSCYHPVYEKEDHIPCGKCLACKVRKDALEWSEQFA